MSKLSDVLRPSMSPERINHPEREQFVTVKLNCGGAVQRQIKDGKEPVPFSGYRVAEGQFIYSRIDARNGAFAIIPPELDGAVVSKDFPVFCIDESGVLPRYLMHFFASGRPQREVQQQSFGATNRQRVGEAQFLDLDIPLPPLEEQRRIADILDRADALVAKRRKVIEHLDALGQSIFHEMFADSQSMGLCPLGEIAELQGGRNIVSKDGSAHPRYRVLKISAVTSGDFDPAESKPLPADYEVAEAHVVRVGDLLMSRANTEALVGATAYVAQDPMDTVLPDKVWRFLWLTPSEPVFYHTLLRSSRIRRQIRSMATGTGGSMKNVSKAKLLGLLVPRVPLERQKEFVARARRAAIVRRQQVRQWEQLGLLRRSLSSEVFMG